MFKSDKKEVFSFRKYKGYGLASAVIAAFFFASSVSADVVNNGDGTTTLSNDKASIVVESSKFKEDNEKTATELFNEGAYAPEAVTTGTDSVTLETKTTVKYQTEDGEKISDDVVKTTSETKELDYKVTGTHGKEYTGDDSATAIVDQNLEKKNTIEAGGKKYEYVRSETDLGAKSTLTDTAFNDVTTKASVQGMHNVDGSIKYDAIKNGTRVWVLEELEDGSYGKYALIENAQNLTDEQIREVAKTATSKFSKAEVDAKGGFKSTDSVVVYETNTYAARKQSSEKFGKDFYYEFTANSSNFKKSYIDEIYKVGLDGLEKRGDSYYYKGKEVVTIENFKKNPAYNDDNELVGYTTETDNKYYFDFRDNLYFGQEVYGIPTTYYDVLSDFLIAHPESSIFAGKASDVFWGRGDEQIYYNVSFVARLLNDAFKSKYGLTADTDDFIDKPIDSKAENSRPTEKKTYSFNKTQLNGDEKTYPSDLFSERQADLWKHEIGLSYSEENVEKVRNFIKSSQSLVGGALIDPFNGKASSSVTKQEYSDAVYNKISELYIETFEGQFSSDEIRELRSKFGDSVFNFVGYIVQKDIDDPSTMVFYSGSRIYRNSLGVVTENTESFTYYDEITPLRAYRLSADDNVVRHIYAEVKKGSVIATYSDEDGNKLADDVNVKTDEYAGEDYTTEAKTIKPIRTVETVNGLTKTTTTTYELIKTPDNANGKVVAETTITVPYVYRKVVNVDINGSVIATYKDEDGTILASEEKVITNQNAGTYYAAAAKDIQASATSKITENGREVTLITYELIKTPDNETGEVVGGETLVVPYVYRKVVTNKLVPNNPPVVEEETLKVTRFHSDTGEELQSDVVGFEDAPKIIGDYQFTGTTETNEGGDVQTHIYSKIVTEVPGDAPQVDVPELKVTRYQTEDGTDIKDSEEGFVNAPNTIGNYQFTGTTNLNEGGDVQTHIYSKIVTEVPGDAPKREPEEIQITLHVDEETGKELVEYDPGLTSPKEIEHYTYTGKTTQEEGVRTHYYKKVITEIPGDAPQVDVPQLKVTRYTLEDGTEIKDADEGFVDAPNTIGNYQFTGTTNMNEGNDVQTHIYSKIVTEVPGDAPQVDVPELKVTRYQTEDGTEIKDSEEGFVDATKTIGNYQFTGVTNMNEGNDVQTHIYSKIVTEVPGDAPQVDVPELRLTCHVDEKGNELAPIEEGLNGPRKTIGDYEYTGRTDSNKAGDVLTHVYRKVAVESKVPGDAPQYDIPELKVTRHVDEKFKELIETEKGNQPPRKTIGDNEYTGRTTEKDGITTHVYAPIKHEVPGDAPIVDVPELKVTRYVNEKGEEIKESEAGFINAPKTIGEYEFTGKTELNDGKDVQTHIYKLIEKPVTPTPDPKKPEIPSPRTPEPKKSETPQPEAPKPIETPKSNDSVVESVDQPQFVKDELPKTGETNSNLALVGVSLLTALGLIGFAKRKRED